MKPVPRLTAGLLLWSAMALLAGPYEERLEKDRPVAQWTANPALTQPLLHGGAEIGEGPRPPRHPAFSGSNHAMVFGRPGASLRVPDPGAESPFDFRKGESLTLEAWVQCDALGEGHGPYLVGKGRLGQAGQPPHNQNWALRLREGDGLARVSFLFRDERNATDSSQDYWHRWTAKTGFLPGAGWHHVAVTYTFGQPASMRGYLDGAEVEGEWDMGGPTALGPWVDDDAVWLGSAQNGAASASLRGRLDAVAVFRTALPPETLKARYVQVGGAPGPQVAPTLPPVTLTELPPGRVRVEIFEHAVAELDKGAGDWTVNDSDSAAKTPSLEAAWNRLPTVKTDEWEEVAMALAEVVPKYSPRGLRRDRSSPFLVRLAAAVTLPPGEHRILLRALRGGRLAMDGKVLATSDLYPKPVGASRAADAEAIVDQLEVQLVKETPVLQPGHSEAMAVVPGDGQPHVFTFETFVGGKNLRPELGLPSLSISSGGAPFRLVSADGETREFSEAGWPEYSREQRARVARVAAARRADAGELAYWQMRHDLARQEMAKRPPLEVPRISDAKLRVGNPIDAFIAAKLVAAGVAAAPLTDDAAFLRRATLDTIGLLPTPAEVADFLTDARADKRARAIERLLTDERWADQWVPYWQDVLAENPAILKATLNNTGPFRFFLHDALRDNWAMDRFATALVAMEGSGRNGGSAGFAIATQNDLPMANKAQILGAAFLGMEMKCARCHDAPNHPFDQADLFKLSAMLQREPVVVPGSSLTQGLNANSHVTVSLKAGQKIEAHWPFPDLPSEPLPGVLHQPDDTREQLAAMLTDPRNERFAQVLVNRLWKRYVGFGIVESVDDWDGSAPSHRELLQWLGRELITHDYDLKHIARLVLNSDTYQRVVTAAGSRPAKSGERLFASPARRRMSAEQIVDSLFQIAGKDFHCEPLNFDLDARRTMKDFLNLGAPQRAWEFVGLSNERDRPSLGKPTAQPFTDVLSVFGWRDSRAEPKSTRDEAANVLQPALLANGTLGARITRLSDDSAFTALALHEQPLDALVTQLFHRVLTRAPSPGERAAFTAALRDGYEDRQLAVPSGDVPAQPRQTKFAMWSNHLHPDSTPIVYALERTVRAGDTPTPRLVPAWRDRLEDAIWALMLTPEFTFIP